MEIKKFNQTKPINTKSENNLAQELVNPIALPDSVVATLNSRIGDEYAAYFLYRNAANWCKEVNYRKAAAFFENEAANELGHSKDLQDYLTQWNIIPSIPQSQTQHQFESLIDIINKAYTMEYSLLQKYSEDQKSLLDSHPATFNFIQKFVDIQTAEVAEYADLLNGAMLVDHTDKFQVLYFEQTYFQ